MDRKEPRAAEHKERKLARKADFRTPSSVAACPEPGFPLPISDARRAANRANAQRSTGPVAKAGRATSSRNHTIHGLGRHNGAFKLLASEDPAGFEALKQSLAAEHRPTTEAESILVTAMAESHWLSNRAQNLQATCFDETTGQIADPQLFSLYLRYQTDHTRAFHRSLNDLLKLREEERKTEHGFEAQHRRAKTPKLASAPKMSRNAGMPRPS
jgi:hypothetical protein